MSNTLKQAPEDDDPQMTSEVTCTFRTTLPDQYKVQEEFEIQLDSSSVNKDLAEIVKQMIIEEGQLNESEEKELQTRKLQFMINDNFLTMRLQDLMEKLLLTSEHTLEVWYSFALDKPKQKMSIPQDEWISAIRALHHEKNLKAKTYVAAFCNGDVKIFDGKDKGHKELLQVSKLHEDQITDVLYLKSDVLNGNKYLISCSEQPFPALKVSEVNAAGTSLTVLSQTSEKVADQLNGFNGLALNPLSNEVFASCSTSFIKTEREDIDAELSSVQIWKLSEDSLSNFVTQAEGSLKRQRTDISTFAPAKYVQINGGVDSLAWLDGDNLVAGCRDHAIKIIDVEKSYVTKQSIQTEHKVPTSMDTSQDHLILTGSEDAIIRLWDCRTGENRPAKQMVHQYEGHNQWIQQVKFNPQIENVFVSGSSDGTVKLWDLRNDDAPLANLKHKGQADNSEFKIFATEWNGASQILSGGSDSHISVHQM